MTLEEFEEAAPGLGRCELVKGVVHDMSPTNPWHAIITVRFSALIQAFVADHDLGYVLCGDPGYVTDPDPESPTVLAPDVAFTRKERVKDHKSTKFPTIPPDLCVEVLSPSDRVGEVQKKVQQWLEFGVRLVWVADPENRTVTAYRTRGKARVYHEPDTLPGEDVLPGFKLSLRKLFE